MEDEADLEEQYALAVEMGLPPGWRVKNRGRKGSCYYDTEGKRYVNLAELQQGLGGELPEEIQRKPRKKPELQVLPEPATECGLPEGWKVRRYSSKNVYYSPEGERFTSLKVALEVVGAPPLSNKKSRHEENGESKAVALVDQGKPKQPQEAAHDQEEAYAARQQEAPPDEAAPADVVSAGAPQEEEEEEEDEEELRPAAAAAEAGGSEITEAPALHASGKKRGGVPSQFPVEPATEFGLPDGWTVRRYNRKNVFFDPAGARICSLATALSMAAASTGTTMTAATAAAVAVAATPRSKRKGEGAGQSGSAGVADHSPPSSAGPAGGSGGAKKQTVAAPRTRQANGRYRAAESPERAEKRGAERGLALELGLPAGWRVRRGRSNASYYCWDSDGRKFSKPKEVAAALGGRLPEELRRRWARSDDSDAAAEAAASKRPGGSSSRGSKRKREEEGGSGNRSSRSSSSSSVSDAEPATGLKQPERQQQASQPPVQQQGQSAPSAATEGGRGSISLQLTPAELQFLRGAHSQSRIVRLTTSGSTVRSSYIAFKVLTNITTPHNAEPTLGALPPGGAKDVLITLHPRGGADPNRDKHAFLFQAVACESKEGVAKELWGKMDPKAITDIRLPIRWVDEWVDASAPDEPGAASTAGSGGSPPAKVEAAPADQQATHSAEPTHSALPEPWEMHWSEDHRMYYYWNTETEESRWTVPTS